MVNVRNTLDVETLVIIITGAIGGGSKQKHKTIVKKQRTGSYVHTCSRNYVGRRFQKGGTIGGSSEATVKSTSLPATTRSFDLGLRSNFPKRRTSATEDGWVVESFRNNGNFTGNYFCLLPDADVATTATVVSSVAAAATARGHIRRKPRVSIPELLRLDATCRWCHRQRHNTRNCRSWGKNLRVAMYELRRYQAASARTPRFLGQSALLSFL